MVNPITTGNPILGTKLLGFSIGRGLGALKGLKWRRNTVKMAKKRGRHVQQLRCEFQFYTVPTNRDAILDA